MSQTNRRILIVDDDRALHAQYRRVLNGPASGQAGGAAFDLDSAYQGSEAHEKVAAAVAAGQRYAVAFVDLHMPPGWDGMRTVHAIWDADPDVQVVICTGSCDDAWEQHLGPLNAGDRLLVLKKPFDIVEMRQLAAALTEKWRLTDGARRQVDQLERGVAARTAELAAAVGRLTAEAAQRRAAEASLRVSEEQYRISFECAVVGKCHVDPATGRFLRVNAKFSQITGYSREELTAMTFRDLTHPDDRAADGARFADALAAPLGDYFTEKRYVRKDGRTIWVQVDAAALRDADGRPTQLLGVVQDITDRKASEARLRHDALHDPLTGLANRSLLAHQLAGCLARYKRDPRELFALLFMDLDRFKRVNDTLGHGVGDKLLVAVARRLSEACRATDVVGRPAENPLVRLGGDEFVLLLDRVGGPRQAMEVAERVRGSMAEPFQIDGHTIVAQSSIGIAVARPEYERPEEVLRDADAALYRAKANRGSCAIFDQAMHDDAVARGEAEAELARAVAGGQLELHYQPIVALHGDRRVVALEALLRWRHPRRGLLSPAAFLPLAEETGLSADIGRWVVRRACERARHWTARAADAVPVCVNVSPRQLAQADLVQHVESSLHDAATPAGLLRLEVTEAALGDAVAGESLRRLRNLGVGIYLDDFGTGATSLTRLHRVGAEGLKIDGSLVAAVETDAVAASIVESIAAVARRLGMTVTAEAVETAAQVQIVRALGCDCAQGYFHARPMPEAEVDEYLAAHAAGRRPVRASA